MQKKNVHKKTNRAISMPLCVTLHQLVVWKNLIKFLTFPIETSIDIRLILAFPNKFSQRITVSQTEQINNHYKISVQNEICDRYLPRTNKGANK